MFFLRLFNFTLKESPVNSIPISPSPTGEGWDEVLEKIF
jgi:hypothetical protein